MDKETIKRNLRLLGTICAMILAVIGSLGIDVPTIQDSPVLSAITTLLCAIAAPVLSYWYNNNHTAGAKMAQPFIKVFNTAIKNEVNDMGRGEEDE